MIKLTLDDSAMFAMLLPSLQTVFETPFSQMQQNLMQYQTAIIIVVIIVLPCVCTVIPELWRPFHTVSGSTSRVLIWLSPFFLSFLILSPFRVCPKRRESESWCWDTHTHNEVKEGVLPPTLPTSPSLPTLPHYTRPESVFISSESTKRAKTSLCALNMTTLRSLENALPSLSLDAATKTKGAEQ